MRERTKEGYIQGMEEEHPFVFSLAARRLFTPFTRGRSISRFNPYNHTKTNYKMPMSINVASEISSSFSTRFRISGWFHGTRLVPPRKPPRLLMDVLDMFRGRRVERLHLHTEGRTQSTRIVLHRARQCHIRGNNGRSALTSPTFLVTPFCSLNVLA